jgi:hypothetical protein
MVDHGAFALRLAASASAATAMLAQRQFELARLAGSAPGSLSVIGTLIAH